MTLLLWGVVCREGKPACQEDKWQWEKAGPRAAGGELVVR